MSRWIDIVDCLNMWEKWGKGISQEKLLRHRTSMGVWPAGAPFGLFAGLNCQSRKKPIQPTKKKPRKNQRKFIIKSETDCLPTNTCQTKNKKISKAKKKLFFVFSFLTTTIRHEWSKTAARSLFGPIKAIGSWSQQPHCIKGNTFRLILK